MSVEAEKLCHRCLARRGGSRSRPSEVTARPASGLRRPYGGHRLAPCLAATKREAPPLAAELSVGRVRSCCAASLPKSPPRFCQPIPPDFAVPSVLVTVQF